MGTKYNYAADRRTTEEELYSLKSAVATFNEKNERAIVQKLQEAFCKQTEYVVEAFFCQALGILTENMNRRSEWQMEWIREAYPYLPKNWKPFFQKEIATWLLNYEILVNDEDKERFFQKKGGTLRDKYLYAALLQKSGYYLEAAKKLFTLKEESQRAENDMAYIRSLELLSDTARKVDSKEFSEYVEELDRFLMASREPDFATHYLNVGLYFSQLKHPEKAVEYYRKSLEFSSDLFYTASCYALKACLENKMEPPRIFLQEPNTLIRQDSQDEFMEPLYRYLRMRLEQTPDEVLEDYILTFGPPAFAKANRVLYDILEQELIMLTEKTGNKNKLYNFRRLRTKSAE